MFPPFFALRRVKVKTRLRNFPDAGLVMLHQPGSPSMPQALFLAGTIVVSAALIVLGCLAIFAGVSRLRQGVVQKDASAEQGALFIFRDQTLIDCSARAQSLLLSLAGTGAQCADRTPWSMLRDYLIPRFPGVDAAMADLSRSGSVRLDAADGGALSLTASHVNGIVHLRLSDCSDESALLAMDRLGYDALQKELRTMRFVLRHMPGFVWQENADGQVIWANSAYLKALDQGPESDSIISWPLPKIFDAPKPSAQSRIALELEGKTRWFSHVEVSDDECTTHFANPIDSTVQSETARRQTLQTLTHTFSALPIGLALFDSDRRLQVFNPALVDLTGLQPLFLAARPSFEQVLYSLRESRMLPEPKDFNSWRKEILDLETAAESGDYAEEWSLDSGKTYLVTGRPQPDGAIALFMQDITSEATLTRSFRAEIDTAQNALNGLEQAIVIFGLNGQTLLSNVEYSKLWNTDPCSDLADRGLSQAISIWSEACEPTTFWARLAEFVASRLRDPEAGQQRSQISGSAKLLSGDVMRMKACRLAGGSTMVLFDMRSPTSVNRPLPPERNHASHPQAAPRPEPVEAAHANMLTPQSPGDEGARKILTARHAGNRARA